MKIFSNSPYLTKKNVFGLYRHEIGIKVRISVEFVISSCHVQKIKAAQIIFETILNFYLPYEPMFNKTSKLVVSRLKSGIESF